VKLNWMTPIEGSWLRRFMAGQTRKGLGPGQFLCGLRADSAGLRGASSAWRYQASSVDGDKLVFGRRRLAVGLTSVDPIEPWVEPRTNFLVFAAVERESAVAVELSVEQRDAYLLTESSLVERP
jgi:hypothetical protein